MSDLADVLVDREGRLRVPEAVFADALAWLILGCAGEQLPDEAARHLGAFAKRAGVTGDMDAAGMRAAVERYFLAHPLPGDLKTALEQAVRALSTQGGALEKQVANVIGTQAARGVLERTAPPPAGTVAAGPMARFAIKNVEKK